MINSQWKIVFCRPIRKLRKELDMITPIKLETHLNRFCTFYELNNKAIPEALFKTKSEKPDLSDIHYPLPARKDDYTCYTVTDDGALWLGADNGVARYFPKAERKDDIVLHFSAPRYLYDNNVKAIMADGNAVWVLTETGAVRIEMRPLSPREKANILLEETLKYVDRRGMVSQKKLQVPRDLDSIVSYGHSDNDGCFTAGFAIGEILHYAVLKREKGEDDPETQRIRKIATRASEACLLLMNISGRGNGFVARSYLTPDEPVPDDGLFYRKSGGKAVCLETRASKKRGIAGLEIDASTPVPDRLAALYRERGYSDDGIVYKGDTSSDEMTLHFLHLYFAHKFLAPGDPELGELIKSSIKATMKHIIDHGNELHECDGKPTTWAKWSLEYFNSPFGWSDACLNAGQILMYLLVTMEITGEQGIWREHYDKLVSLGYADLTTKHHERFYQISLMMNLDCAEELMYGDNMLATATFWGLLMLEKDKELRKKYKKGFESWRGEIAREYNPGYDFPFKLVCPDAELYPERIKTWFYRFHHSRLAAGVSMTKRFDIPVRKRRGGYLEISALCPPDETFIAKYDRNPRQFRDEDSGGVMCVESCYVYTFAYWIGIYYGLISD